MASSVEITIKCQVSPDLERMLAAAKSLEPKFLELFVDGVGSASELIRVYVDDGFTLGASDLRVVLEPTDRFRNLMAAVAF